MFHFDCVNLTKRFFQKLIPYKNIRWKCDDCLNLDLSELKSMKLVMAKLNAIEIIVKSNKKELLNQKCEIDQIKKMVVNVKATSGRPSTTVNLLNSGTKTTPLRAVNKRSWSQIVDDNQTDTPVASKPQ